MSAASASDLLDDNGFWNLTLLPVLHRMIEDGRYSLERQAQVLEFFRKSVGPSLGPEPQLNPVTGRRLPSWRSFVTDDFTPFEPSLTWSSLSPHPYVKFSIEAIPGIPGDGGAIGATSSVAHLLAQRHNMGIQFDLGAFNQVASLLTCTADCGILTSECLTGDTGPTQVMFGFDLGETTTQTKAYFVPTIRAMETGRSKLDLIASTIQACGVGTAWEPIAEYIRSVQDADPFLLAMDCAPLDDARFKAYIRFPTANLDVILRHASLGGRISLSPKFVEAVRALWECLPHDDASTLEYRLRSQTSGGTPIYFSMKRDAPAKPKLYVPVRLLGSDDHQVAKAFEKWMTQIGNVEAGASYIQHLKKILPDKDISCTTGCQTYIGITAPNDQDIECSVYLNPKVF
ncbi:aromatic prenyltransferase [Auricularia subglabra TFB-10046 SS5]|uniref:Aromatic prenyltransferase n=1 Tax=Auricularia subglabra (strain TFB-10046 / SS5) TaxID=717982 RepID=J0WRC0_AURST|nr:aromatic prenyltransferase [Auricularia subglabra TFB-10046 SS5]